MRKGFSAIFGVVAILAVLALTIFVAGRIYFLGTIKSTVKKDQQIYLNENVTKNWQSYSDSDLNISFKYPPGWHVYNFYKEPTYLLGIHNYSGTGMPYGSSAWQKYYLIVIDNATRPGSKSADELVAMEKQSKIVTMGGTYYYKNQKEFNVNQYKAFYVEETNKEGTTANGKTYLLDGKGKGVILTSQGKEGSQEFLENILSTIRFNN